MATAIRLPAAVELFYSYAHTDEQLCKELQKHLTALKRSGLIRDWYDRKIEPGDEWGVEIHDAMERAGIILLLISADFLASKYIFEVELPFELQRHDSGRARVIPILLRPVEWHDSPFARLQVLPSEARAVTLWPNQDEAFSDIAGRLRELIYDDRLREGDRLREVTPDKPPVPAAAITQERELDAAIASSVVINEPTDLVTMVRATESGGLKAILRLDRTYSPTVEDVRSATFQFDFPADQSGRILPATLELALESPGFDPPRQRKKIRIPVTGDTGVSVFMLTPTRAGNLRLNLQAISADVEIGSRELVTTSVSAIEAQPILSYGVTSLPIKQSADPRRELEPKSFTAMAAPPPGAPPTTEPPRPPAMAYEVDVGTAKSPPAQSRSRRGAWIGIASSAAALALVCTAVVWNGNDAARSPGSTLVPVTTPSPNIPAAELYLQRAKQLQSAGKIDDALSDAKHATEIAPNNAQAHLLYGELLEKADLKAQALREYKRVQALKSTPDVRALATRRIAELEPRLSAPDH